MRRKQKSYSELMSLSTFEERFEYLREFGQVGSDTLGYYRYLCQKFYSGSEWKAFRRKIILRDNGCDLGIDDREIVGFITVHHINPLELSDFVNHSCKLLDPENAICTSDITHKAIHYSDMRIILPPLIDRSENDTCPWKIRR